MFSRHPQFNQRLKARLKALWFVIVCSMSLFFTQKAHSFADYIDVGFLGVHSNLKMVSVFPDGSDAPDEETDLSFQRIVSGGGLRLGFDLWKWVTIEAEYATLGSTKVKSDNTEQLEKPGSIDHSGGVFSA